MTIADIDNQKQLSESKSEELAQTKANLAELKENAKQALDTFEATRGKVKELLDAYQELFAKTSQLEKIIKLSKLKCLINLMSSNQKKLVSQVLSQFSKITAISMLVSNQFCKLLANLVGLLVR